jgi:hypothetical protein
MIFTVQDETPRRQHTFEELRNETLPSLIEQQRELNTLDKLAFRPNEATVPILFVEMASVRGVRRPARC